MTACPSSTAPMSAAAVPFVSAFCASSGTCTPHATQLSLPASDNGCSAQTWGARKTPGRWEAVYMPAASRLKKAHNTASGRAHLW